MHDAVCARTRGVRMTLVWLFALSAIVFGIAAAAPALASAADYVAMGDSYSSGTGTRDYFDSNCQRSVYAYPYLIKDSFGSSFSFQACSGAKTRRCR